MSRFLRFPQLKAEKGIPWSRMHVDRLEKAGKFPKRVRLGENTVAWQEDEIDAMLAAKAAERDKVAA
jgi:prophage regulatory protein